MSNWTEEDLARHYAGRSQRAAKPTRDQSFGHLTTKKHKYRAEPCIVSHDLTLFTKTDIHQLAAAEKPFIQREDMPLKELAHAVGISGDWFGSTKEAARYLQLKALEALGNVRKIQRQRPYPLMVNETALGEWRADFNFEERRDGQWWPIVEDSKGMVLPLDKWKRRHVEAQYGVKLRIT